VRRGREGREKGERDGRRGRERVKHVEGFVERMNITGHRSQEFNELVMNH
jgi:hypothetical protein